MSYAELTLSDPSPLKRRLQSRRLNDALSAAGKDAFLPGQRILDFGAGNGELVRRLPGIAHFDAWIFEPCTDLMEEAKENLRDVKQVKFVEKVGSLESAFFDIVF